MKKAILFDLDGTLWDTTLEVEKIWSQVLTRYNFKIPKSKIKKIMGLTKNEIIKELFPNHNQLGYEFITECQKEENRYLIQNGGHIYKNAIYTIKKIIDKYDLYIVSNCQTGYIETFLTYYNLYDYFKDFECSGNTNENKSYNIKKVLERNELEKTNAIYVGDTQNDCIAAQNNDLKFVWAQYGFGDCNKYDYKINDIKELCSLVI